MVVKRLYFGRVAPRVKRSISRMAVIQIEATLRVLRPASFFPNWQAGRHGITDHSMWPLASLNQCFSKQIDHMVQIRSGPQNESTMWQLIQLFQPQQSHEHRSNVYYFIQSVQILYTPVNIQQSLMWFWFYFDFDLKGRFVSVLLFKSVYWFISQRITKSLSLTG